MAIIKRPDLRAKTRSAVRVVCAAVLAIVVAAPHISAAQKFKPFKLKTVDGAEQSLGDVLGKATLVVFFFPTCQYCNRALPHIQKIYDLYRDRGLSVVLINAVPQENSLIAAWRSGHNYTVPTFLGTASVQRDYQLIATPTHVLLDSAGAVVWRGAGYQQGDERVLSAQIQQVLGSTVTPLVAS